MRILCPTILAALAGGSALAQEAPPAEAAPTEAVEAAQAEPATPPPIVRVTVVPPRRDPDSLSAVLDRGYALMQARRIREALAEFDVAAKMAPGASRPHANRGIALFHLGRFDESKKALDKALGLDRDDFVVWQGRALHALVEGRSEQALAAAERSLRLDPGNGFNLRLKFEALLQLGRFADAEKALVALIPDMSDQVRGLTELARLQARRGGYDEAIATFDRAAAVEPDNIELPRGRAQLLERAGRTEAAGAAWKEALARTDARIAAASEPRERRQLLRLRSRILSGMGETAEAIRLDGELIAERPDHASAYNSRCWHRAIAGVELEEALADCNRALELAPGNAAYLDSRGLVNLRLGRMAEAIADYDAAIRAQANNASSLYGRGLAKLRLGDMDGGRADLGAARRFLFDIDAQYDGYGLRADDPPAGGGAG